MAPEPVPAADPVRYRLEPTDAPCDACGQPIQDGETCWLRGIWENGAQVLNVRVHDRCWHEDYGRPALTDGSEVER